MRLPSWRAARSTLTAAGLTVIVFAGYQWWCGDLSLDPEQLTAAKAAWAAEEMLTVLLLAALAGAFGAWQARGHYRRFLHELRGRIAALREDPSPHALDRLGDPDGGNEFEAVRSELTALAECYRKALVGVVQAHEELESLREPGRRVTVATSEQPTSSVPTRYLLGSSRHRMVARLAPNLHWMAATPPLQQFLGTNVQDLVARSFLDHVHPDDSPGLVRTFQEAAREGEGHNIAFRILVPTNSLAAAETAFEDHPLLLADGSPVPHDVRHLQMDVMTCYTAAGVPLHLRCHFVDITDEIRSEKALRGRTDELSQANARLRQINVDLQRLKESYRDLYHYAPALYFSLDPGGNLVAFNETMLRTLGCSREALFGRPYTQILPPACRDGYLADPEVFQRPGELETQWVKQDGTVIDVWIATTPIKDPQGKFVRSRSAARDVTDRNRLENALRAKADELSQANALLRRINQELEDFTYVVSHDLKEPLRTLQAFSNFLLLDYGQKLGEEGHEYISHLIQASKRLGMLIDDLLTLSRAGRVIHTPHAFSWDEAVRTVRSDLHDLIARQGASVHVEGSLPAVAGDSERVVQLLTNLIANGLKYNKSTVPEVVLGALPPQRFGGRDFVTFFVRDNGVGIEPQYHEQVFRMFRRLHRHDEVEGTGAGLAICKKIVEAHGGRLWVESTPGLGATFYFTLPRLQAGRRPTTVVILPNGATTKHAAATVG